MLLSSRHYFYKLVQESEFSTFGRPFSPSLSLSLSCFGAKKAHSPASLGSETRGLYSLLFLGCALARSAAPGGKSLCILFNIFANTHQTGKDIGAEAFTELKGTEIVSNEPSPSRRSRLANVLREYIPSSILEDYSRITRNDGSLLFKREVETYDKVLVDAPCGSERHLLHQTKGELYAPTRRL